MRGRAGASLAIRIRLIGVNNRDLTFTVDLGTTERLERLAKSGETEAPSDIHTRADVERLEACGSDAILVRTSSFANPTSPPRPPSY